MSLLKTIAMGAVSLLFPPAIPLIAGVSAIAKAIGGEPGARITDGVDMITDGLEMAGKKPLSPEQQVDINLAQLETDKALAEIGYKTEKLRFDDQAGGREVIKTALLSDDPVVRQARPKMMILLGKVSMLYTGANILFTAVLLYLDVSLASIKVLTDLMISAGYPLWGAFVTSFTGYTIARSADKKFQAVSDNGLDPSKLLGLISKIGHKIS